MKKIMIISFVICFFIINIGASAQKPILEEGEFQGKTNAELKISGRVLVSGQPTLDAVVGVGITFLRSDQEYRGVPWGMINNGNGLTIASDGVFALDLSKEPNKMVRNRFVQKKAISLAIYAKVNGHNYFANVTHKWAGNESLDLGDIQLQQMVNSRFELDISELNSLQEPPTEVFITWIHDGTLAGYFDFDPTPDNRKDRLPDTIAVSLPILTGKNILEFTAGKVVNRHSVEIKDITTVTRTKLKPGKLVLLSLGEVEWLPWDPMAVRGPNTTKDFQLTHLKNKKVVLYFWGIWCPPCIRDGGGISKLSKVSAATAKSDSVALVAIHMIYSEKGQTFAEIDEAMKKRQKDYNDTFKSSIPEVIISFQEANKKYGIMTAPTTLVGFVDINGKFNLEKYETYAGSLLEETLKTVRQK